MSARIESISVSPPEDEPATTSYLRASNRASVSDGVVTVSVTAKFDDQIEAAAFVSALQGYMSSHDGR